MFHIYLYIDPQYLCLHLKRNKWYNVLSTLYIIITIIIIVIIITIIIITITVIIIIIIIIIFLFIHCHGNSPCIIVLYRGGSKKPIRLPGRERSQTWDVFRPRMFGLSILPKETQSRLFKVSN